MLITPSLGEGFGRTPVEAAIAGKPVISSKSGSLVEVTQGLVSYYENAADENELADEIIRLRQAQGTPENEEHLSRISDILTNAYSTLTIGQQYLDILLK